MKRSPISKDGKRVAIYCRVSTDDQDCDRQVRDLTAFAERASFQVVSIERETMTSKRVDKLQARARVIDLARTRQIDSILVTELTRWGRSTVDLLTSLKTLNDYGVSVTAQNGPQFDMSTADGQMMAGIFAVLAQFERDLISERTKSGLAAAVARGSQLGRPVGNKTDGKHRKAVIELSKSGFSYRDIASKLKIGKDTVARCLKVNK